MAHSHINQPWYKNSDLVAGGLLFIAAILSLIVANVPLGATVASALNRAVTLPLSGAHVSIGHIINDGLMVLFFLLVGLEIKAARLSGALKDTRQVLLPAFAAIGGMAVPALIYVAFNWGQPIALRGWAIPSATDIAFSLGVLSLVASRVPVGLKIFLTTLAVLDDLGAIIIIGLFYTADLDLNMLAVAAACIATLFVMNRLKIARLTPYLLIGTILWYGVLKSGVHATLAGVITALFIPSVSRDARESAMHRLEHTIKPWVTYLILPLFAFANAGVSLAGVTSSVVLSSVTLGIAVALTVGKTIGVLTATWACTQLKIAPLPAGATWSQVAGIALLCGIGFTMSLFIGTLAFENESATYMTQVKFGVLSGSVISGLLGLIVLAMGRKKP